MTPKSTHPARSRLCFPVVLTGLLIALTDQHAWADQPVPGVVVADSVRKYRFLGKMAREKKEFDDALRHYREVLRYLPEDLKAHFFIGRIMVRKGEMASAKRHLLRCASFDSLHVNSRVLLTQIYLRSEQPDSAWVFLSTVLRAKPGTAKYHQFRRQVADAYRIGGDQQSAISHYTALVDQGENDDELFDLLSRLHQAEGDTAQALEWSSRALHASGSSDNARIERLNRIFEIQIDSGDNAAAFETLRHLAHSDSISRYAYFSRMVHIARQTRDRAWELEGLEGVVAAHPQDLESLATLVEFHLRREDVSAASDWLTRGLNIDSQNGHLRLLEGELLILRGDEDAAIVSFERARKDPQWGEVAQQRIWQLRPPETEEEKLKRVFFGTHEDDKPDG